ncbi:sulfotransferase [Nonomuraea endophytica]|uniref:sulfotransferase n=1 Tax=Nonomuraea endophytica TaxID=714136 RepID=UPI0037CB23B2
MISVIGAGLPRTGTTSLKATLQRLGLGPCHHMQEIGAHPEQAQRWRQTLDGPVDWNNIPAAVDRPSTHFWRPLAWTTIVFHGCTAAVEANAFVRGVRQKALS